ncbi:MAG TPA: hypothetical protein VHK70_08840 [Burkholderiaceae bacterium]|jgi:uncharacterized protein with PQ loop repeat|nr:hypothetical protein [Burkholderiaceae bacterium]
MYTDAVGWISAIVLALTISRQVHLQWRSGNSEGLSPWLFVGQLVASAGFVIYSALLRNWVFVFANFYLFLAAMAGQLGYLRNKRRLTRNAASETWHDGANRRSGHDTL